ncbi:class I SAM-dependent methyltransferase [Glutamicibacter nicotianae]|uniref:class I SAM-dependent methyltransferase n=1 Tax=Glutamicibacter nicotianae TaxID=37929 RepID=UPI0013CEBAFA|nr:class I SAM-dependent methyltransferase [Glutamicibacter nicotianae]
MNPELFGVFRKIADRVEGIKFESYYGPAMSDFMRDTAWEQTWDIPSLLAHFPEANEELLVADLGTGDGRIIKRLQDAGINSQFVGIDTSEAAHLRFLKRQKENGFSAHFLLADFLMDKTKLEEYDIAFFGSVSINGLHSISLLRSLFDSAQGFLKDGGTLILSVYTDDAVEKFPELNGVLDVTPYSSESGESRLMWRGLQYEGSAFRHNAYVEGAAGDASGVICWERERVWSETELLEIAALAGWKSIRRSVSSVADGGAEGFEVATLSFTRSA